MSILYNTHTILYSHKTIGILVNVEHTTLYLKELQRASFVLNGHVIHEELRVDCRRHKNEAQVFIFDDHVSKHYQQKVRLHV